MNRDHQFEICRALYQLAREQGSPSVAIVHLVGDYFCGQTTDGIVLRETVTGCCKWAMKYKIASEWLEAQKRAKENSNSCCNVSRSWQCCVTK